jgi:hypothetical protein
MLSSSREGRRDFRGTAIADCQKILDKDRVTHLLILNMLALIGWPLLKVFDIKGKYCNLPT